MPSMKVLADLVGDSPGIRAVRDTIARLLSRPQDVRRMPSILIEGETGSGKGLLARMIHRAGPRPDGPFIDVNCAAIPDTLLEAEMFGFERGAFTDARRSKPGLFQAAHRGTIFLDEVGLLPEALQAKLLKVLEDRTVRRLGATRDEPIDVWVLTATNEDLRRRMRERRFREDLYHRLAVLTVTLPPLRERGGDIDTLAEHFLARTCAEYGIPRKSLTPEARRALLGYPWPGNVRELSNVVERAVLLAAGSELTVTELGLPAVSAAAAPAVERTESPVSLDDAMREHLVEVLGQTGWNISRTAALLGISRNTLRARMDKYGLRERESAPPKSPPKSRPARAPAAESAVPPVPLAVPAPGPVPAPLPVPSSVRRWERRRLAFVRVALVPPTGPEALLTTGRVLEDLVDKVGAFGGVLEGVGPIGLVAAFGLDAAGDAADRAAHAAMAILKAVDRARKELHTDVGARAGLHVSPVLISMAGGGVGIDMDERRDLWPLLDELVERASLDTILVSAAAAPFLRRRFELAPGPGPVANGATTHVLVGRERTGLGLGGRVVQFVGRRFELELLRGRLESASRRQGQVVTIVGEAGIGKSRLVHEFRQGLAPTGVECVVVHCFPYGGAVPYLPVIELVRTLCGIGDLDTPEVVTGKVYHALGELSRDAGELSPYVLHLLGLKEGGERLALESEAALRTRIFEIVRQLLRQRSHHGTLVVVVDDLHWIDRTSEEFMASVVDSLPGVALLLIATSRPDYRPPWSGKSYATHVALQPLEPAEARRFVGSVLGTEDVPDPVLEAILSRGEGNAFFLEELARVLRGHSGPTSVVVPDTVQDVLQTRIDRLAPADRQLLSAAAVIGKDFTASLLEATLDLPGAVLRDGLSRLQAAEFVYETSAGPDAEFTFRHGLTHEVAYAGLAAADRRALHARIADALARDPRPPSGEDLERRAHHALEAERWAQALGYLREAGARAFAGGAHREAVACFERALGALGQLPAAPERLRDAIDLRIDLRTALLPPGEYERIFTYLREAEELAVGLGDQGRLGRICTYLTHYFFITGDPDRALDYGGRALAIAEVQDDFRLRAEAQLRLGQVHHALGDYRQAVAVLREPLRSLTGELRFDRFGLPLIFAVGCRYWLVRSLTELGDFEAGRQHAEEALAIANEAGHPFSRTVASWTVGHLALRRGDAKRALEVLEPGLELARKWTIQAWVPRLAAAVGSALALVGRAAEAVPLLERAVEQSVTMRSVHDYAGAVAALGEGYVLAGRRSDAARTMERALALARAHRDRGIEAWLLWVRGESAVDDHPAVATEAFQAGLTLAEELGMRPLAAHCCLALGAMALRAQRRGEAAEQLERARRLYAELQMAPWLARVEAEQQRLG
jgi:transcriptional regulator with AAA-type ATPase domain/tetratricopeptide (TPR) repeat protein